MSGSEDTTQVDAIGAGAGIGVVLLLAVVVFASVFMWHRRYARIKNCKL